ncbi:TetR/AcrR family transcriptional regulator [Sphingomonas ginsengisoli (ex An et al. 2013)]|uniref:TetR/AcrR family transcriptional regulator n=1 Tax=Sphingomonas ginsengisoli (ex An et al. 2013) TaxID=363835 RepID=UPI0023DCFCA7|nr:MULTISPECIES: TetR/AcrR family transcriptional regulator [Sphingomonas]
MARAVFFEHGYGATSMSRIAEIAGGSKTTLWTYFPSKEALFAAVCDDLVERYGRALTTPIDPSAPIAEQLRLFGSALLDTVLSPPMIDLQRLVIGEAARFPEMARLFFERGPARGKARLASLVRAAMDRGDLRAADPALAASQFVGLLQARSWHWLLLGLVEDYPAEQRMAEIEMAVASFLTGWKPTD